MDFYPALSVYSTVYAIASLDLKVDGPTGPDEGKGGKDKTWALNDFEPMT